MTRNEISKELAALGLKNGDIVLLHSSLASLGIVEGGADSVVDAFLDVLGNEGTLVVPTFGALGIITDIVRARPEVVSSIQPNASIAAIGAKAAEICADHWKAETAHAEETPYMKIADMGGYVCLLGIDQDRNTTLHTVEELLRLSYLKPTKEATFNTHEGEQTKSWPYFPGPHRDFIGLDRIFRESGKMRTGKIGSSVVRLIKSGDLIELGLEQGRHDPAFVLCDNPNCADCVGQRADLDRSFFGNEDFVLACSSSLAGRYVPEMIENMKNAGIDRVELDCIQGQPIQLINAEKLAKAVNEIRDEGCEISGIRLRTTGDITALLELMRKIDVTRLVLPLTVDAEDYVTRCREENVTISFYNASISSVRASEILLELKEKNLNCGFTFNAANFAVAGEKPFLSSYKEKLRRFVDQLDVEDALFDGVPTDLACGNAEIKEMISILRCASFSGVFLLGAGNGFYSDLADTVTQFKWLLANM